jgi:hypothetical protein
LDEATEGVPRRLSAILVADYGRLFPGDEKENFAELRSLLTALVERVSAGRRRAAVPLDRPALAVLSFQNLGGDKETEFFLDSVAEDLITEPGASAVVLDRRPQHQVQLQGEGRQSRLAARGKPARVTAGRDDSPLLPANGCGPNLSARSRCRSNHWPAGAW